MLLERGHFQFVQPENLIGSEHIIDQANVLYSEDECPSVHSCCTPKLIGLNIVRYICFLHPLSSTITLIYMLFYKFYNLHQMTRPGKSSSTRLPEVPLLREYTQDTYALVHIRVVFLSVSLSTVTDAKSGMTICRDESDILSYLNF